MDFYSNHTTTTQDDGRIQKKAADLNRPPQPYRLRQLTTREKETLRYIAEGYTAEETAQGLYISKQTVDSHRKNIIKKLGVPNVVAAVAHALRNNIIV